MSKQKEDVLLMVKHVRYKKVDGTLFVNSGRVAWRNQTSDSFRISAAFEYIRLQRVSLDQKEKVQLQLLMHSSESYTFQFSDPAGRQKQLEMRNNVKEMLQQLLPKFKDKAHSELNEKYHILESNPHLLALYKELVVTGILSSEEFWARPEFSSQPATTAKEIARPTTVNKLHERAQVSGVPSYLLSDIKPEMDGVNSIKYNLTPETINSIFRAYPTVKQRHRELVPDKLSENNFWIKFFQSHYFHRDRALINKDDVFGDCDALDERILRTEFIRSRRMRVQAHLDIGDMEDHSVGQGYGITPPSAQQELAPGPTPAKQTKLSTNQLLLRRFNKHSIMILRSLAPSELPSSSQAANHRDATYKEIASSGHLRDQFYRSELCVDEPPPHVELTLTSVKDYFEGPTAVNQNPTPSSISTLKPKQLNPNQAKQALAACKASLAIRRSGCASFLSNYDAQPAIADVSAGGILMGGGEKSGGGREDGRPSNSSVLILSSEQSKELTLLYASAGELLRHFWACFPVTSTALAEKVVRIHDSLLRFNTTKLSPFVDGMAGTQTGASKNGASLYRSRATAHLESMLNCANEKFREWKEFRKR